MDTAHISLRTLLTEVVLARRALHSERGRRPVVRLDLSGAQARLILALRAYEDALRAGGAPMPYRLRDELRLLSAIDHPGR